MTSTRPRVLHVIHDFLPKHQAGSEIYAATLCETLQQRGLEVAVLCTDYDLGLRQDAVRWRFYNELPVIELINNWAFASFEDTYNSPSMNQQLRNILEAFGPDVLHIHNLLNLSFELPAIAREMGIPSVATLHDYTLVCASGGQRVHQSQHHVCTLIDPDRCARCFPEHNFHSRLAYGQQLSRRGRGFTHASRIAAVLQRRMPRLFGALVRRFAPRPTNVPLASAPDMLRRLERVQRVFEQVDLFIAPSPHLGTEYLRLGMPREKLRVSDYGFVPLRPSPRASRDKPLRIGFVGTLVWHKGAHVLFEAVRALAPGSFELQVYGDTTTFPDYVATLRDLGRGLPVHFMGRFERTGVADVYNKMDVLVVPSLWPENSPLVIHEAFQCGVPVVGSREGGTQDLVTHGQDGLLYETFSPSSLASALQTLIDDPALLRTMARAAPPVKTLAQDAAEMESIYRELTDRRPQATGVRVSRARDAAENNTVAVVYHDGVVDNAVFTVQSLRHSLDPDRIVVVNATSSHDGDDELRARLPDVVIVEARGMRGTSAKCNVGIEEAMRRGAESVLMINAGLVVSPDAIGVLHGALVADPKLGVVGPLLVSREDPAIIVSAGLSYSPATGRIRNIASGVARRTLTRPDTELVDATSGSAMLVRRSVLERIGLLDEQYVGGLEDLAFCIRAGAAEFDTACVHRAVVLHHGHLGIGSATRQGIYLATRDHLLLASQSAGNASAPARYFRTAAVGGLNLAHVLLVSDVPRRRGFAEFTRAVRDHRGTHAITTAGATS